MFFPSPIPPFFSSSTITGYHCFCPMRQMPWAIQVCFANLATLHAYLHEKEQALKCAKPPSHQAARRGWARSRTHWWFLILVATGCNPFMLGLQSHTYLYTYYPHWGMYESLYHIWLGWRSGEPQVHCQSAGGGAYESHLPGAQADSSPKIQRFIIDDHHQLYYIYILDI